MSTITAPLQARVAPLQARVKEDMHFQWADKHNKAVEELNTTLINTPVLQYFDLNTYLSQKLKGQNLRQLQN